jgi:hypothetical protein
MAVTGFALPVAMASGLDLHKMWDSRCAQCHGHSGEFARRFLTVSEGRMHGYHHVENLRLFLTNHYVPNGEVEAVHRMLQAQASTPPRFKNECERCHDTAANFVRSSLYSCKDGLCGRKSEQSILSFLKHHRKLTADDVEFFASLLARVAGEIYRP